MKNTHFLILACGLFLAACGAGKNPQDEANLKEARIVHNEAIKTHKDVMKDIAEMKKIKTSLEDSLKKVAAKADDKKAEETKNSLQKQIDACKAQELAMSEWMANIQEVPGEEGEGHDHHDHEGHDHHDHKPAPRVGTQEMLAYQKEMKKNIEKIQQEVKAILKK